MLPLARGAGWAALDAAGDEERVGNDLEQPRVFKPGDHFLRYHYDVEAFLGAGASGQVYAVRHRFTGDRFALKVGHLKDRSNARKVARSLIEAKATYRIQHQNVVRVLDLACEDDGLVWQIMELLEGKSLAELLQRYGRFSPLYAIDVALEVAWGLHAAHEQQVIHRDVQPRNVFVTANGVVKVLDFSLAKVIPSGLQTTRGKRSMGTTAYMAPEHLKGAPATPQFDVYALGMLLWQTMVGRHPFEEHLRDLSSLVLKQIQEDPPSLAQATGLPAYCDDLVRSATAKDTRQRYAGMWPMAQALLELRQRLAADPVAASLVRHRPAWEAQHPVLRDPAGWSQYRAPKC
jgi:eukaryotic-like serine/threonine-protein kinase